MARLSPFFRCPCGKLHTRSAMWSQHSTCTCGRRLDTLSGTTKEA